MVADGLGLPHRCRHAEVTALTGFQSAMSPNHAGMCWVGTMAFEMKARGNTMRNPSDWADSGPALSSPMHPQNQLKE
jgi:hypothetical protein